MESLKKNRTIFILLTFLVLLLIIQFVFNLIFGSPKVISSIPPDSATNVPLKQTFVLEFEKSFNKNILEIRFVPSVIFETSFKDKSLEITPKTGFSLQTKYTLVLKDKRKNKDFFKTDFTTIQSQSSPEVSENAKNITKKSYPLAPFSPPDNANFYFLYTGPLKMNVYLKGNQESAKKEFEDWVKSKGIDLTTHKIQYLTPP